ncbi:hypothetical protein FHX05_005977 [Rhizobium sp. BK491]|nr:hypothetical protein [Rhizobium sp. BK491]
MRDMALIRSRSEPWLKGSITSDVIFQSRDTALDLGQQNLEINRLGQIVRRAGSQAGYKILFVRHCRQKDEGNVGKLRIVDLDLCQQLMAIHLRHRNIANNDIRPFGYQEFQALSSVGGLERRETRFLQFFDNQLPDFRFVVYA